jgi:hypothetical protein
MWKAIFKVHIWPVVYVVIAMFLCKKDASEARKEKLFEKNISKYRTYFPPNFTIPYITF